MPRYFVDTFHGDALIDEHGHEYASRADMQIEVQRALAEMMRDNGRADRGSLIRAEVRDEGGRPVMTAALIWVVDETPARSQPGGSH